MVHISKDKRLKWDKKVMEHILVGYDDNIEGFRVYDKERRKIFTSRDVIR